MSLEGRPWGAGGCRLLKKPQSLAPEKRANMNDGGLMWGAEERHEEGLGAGKMASERRKETVSTPPYLSS